MTGSSVRTPSSWANDSTRGVISFGVPSRRRGSPTTIVATPSSSPARRDTSCAACSRASRSSVAERRTPTGRASVHVASLIATPMRRSPTSNPTIRMLALYTRPVKWLSLALVATLACPATGVAVGAAAQPPDRARTEALARRVNERVRALQREAERLAGEARTLVGDLRKLEIERDLQVEEAQRAEAASAQARQALQDITTRIS